MKEFMTLLTEEVSEAFAACGYEKAYGRVTLSDRPDLCEFQCNGAMAAAKQMHTAPILIAKEIAEELLDRSADTRVPMFSDAAAVRPGFINLTVGEEYLAQYLQQMALDTGDEEKGEKPRFGAPFAEVPRVIFLDYGGPNVAKPLHVGHLRSAVIGESIKRIERYFGHTVIGDVHLGDWGLQMGLIIALMRERQPELCYFDESFKGEYPKDAPFTIADLEEIYPTASKRSKEDEAFKEEALSATKHLQEGRRGYRALWEQIVDVSVHDLRKNYERLNVSFDLWKGESDAQPYIADMVQKMKEEGYATESDGALVVDVREETDNFTVPPCMILKSDGAALYNTTDLATMVWRAAAYHPDEMIYVVDKRQQLYFTQVFRCAKKTGIVGEDTKLTFLGFGTMNGPDGRPFKTREGGVMRLQSLLDAVYEEMSQKIRENENSRENHFCEEEEKKVADLVSLAAVKYADLSNQASKDYIFDIDRFTSFEGNTGPYILYTIVRISSVLEKYKDRVGEEEAREETDAGILPAVTPAQKTLMLVLSRFGGVVREAAEEIAPHKICAFVYELSNACNGFYHETKIVSEPDPMKRGSFICLLHLAGGVLKTCIDLLGFSAPDRM